MASYKDIVVGLQIFDKRDYEVGESCQLPGAEHDIIYGASGPYMAPEELTPDELAALNAAGWSWDADEEHWYKFV